jgi:uncharacterized Zn-binding protein involved in type VI secretion
MCPIHGPGVVVTGSPTSILNSRPVARVGDLVSCGATIITGSAIASLDGGQPIARLGDVTSHGGTLIAQIGAISHVQMMRILQELNA